MTGFLAFMWYGVAFYYHANMHGKEPVETVVHVLPISLMVMIATASESFLFYLCLVPPVRCPRNECLVRKRSKRHLRHEAYSVYEVCSHEQMYCNPRDQLTNCMPHSFQALLQSCLSILILMRRDQMKPACASSPMPAREPH